MSSIGNARGAFMQALNEARELHDRNTDPFAIAEVMRNARELLDIICPAPD